MGKLTINGGLMGFNGIYMDLPSGELSFRYGKSPCYENGKIHYFDWAIFNSKLLVYQMVFGVPNRRFFSTPVFQQRHLWNIMALMAKSQVVLDVFLIHIFDVPHVPSGKLT